MSSEQTERKPPTGTSTGKFVEIRDVKFEVLQGTRGGYFFINSRGSRSSLRPKQREELGLDPAPAYVDPSVNLTDKDGNPTHPDGVYTGSQISTKDGDRPVFRNERGSYFYITPAGSRTSLRPHQCEAAGLEAPAPREKRERKPPIGTSTGKFIEIRDAKFEVLQGTRGGYFFINSNGNRSSLRPKQREELGLEAPPPRDLKDGVVPKKDHRRGERKPPTGTSTGKFIEIRDAKFEVLQGTRGGYFFINSNGNRSSLRPNQCEALGLEAPQVEERKPPTGTSTGKFLEFGDDKKEVFQGPNGGYYFITQNGNRSSLRPQQRANLGLTKKE